jgi:signal peptidase I
MKRVVGLPGERVQVVDGQVVIDGRRVERPASLAFLNYLSIGKLHSGRAVECGDGYFLLGDDSADSWDSRYQGPFERWRVRGRAWLIVGPSERVGWVNP